MNPQARQLAILNPIMNNLGILKSRCSIVSFSTFEALLALARLHHQTRCSCLNTQGISNATFIFTFEHRSHSQWLIKRLQNLSFGNMMQQNLLSWGCLGSGSHWARPKTFKCSWRCFKVFQKTLWQFWADICLFPWKIRPSLKSIQIFISVLKEQ